MLEPPETAPAFSIGRHIAPAETCPDDRILGIFLKKTTPKNKLEFKK
jgi:hypothetical protein